MDKVKALMEGVTQDIIAYLVEEDGYSIEDAADKVYTSEVFRKLSDRETGIYRESSAYVATLLKDELSKGTFLQAEV
jgi:hypothetical protein